MRQLVPATDHENIRAGVAQDARKTEREVRERLTVTRAPDLAEGSMGEPHLVVTDVPIAARVGARKENNFEVHSRIGCERVERRAAVRSHDRRE